jgi:hypothetical protein
MATSPTRCDGLAARTRRRRRSPRGSERTMQVDVRRVEYADVAALRDLYRQEQNCQIIHDSILARAWPIRI